MNNVSSFHKETDPYFCRECAPSTSFYIIFNDVESTVMISLMSAGFRCAQCTPGAPRKGSKCYNCTFCKPGHHSDVYHNGCVPCPVGK